MSRASQLAERKVALTPFTLTPFTRNVMHQMSSAVESYDSQKFHPGKTPRNALLCVHSMYAIVQCVRNCPPKLPAGIHRACSSELLFHARIKADTAGFLFPSIIRQENY